MQLPKARTTPLFACAAIVAATLAAPAARAQSADELAQRLADLRAEVEELSEELAAEKTETRNELQSLARQKSDLRVELDRESIRVSKLRAAIDKKREQLESTTNESEELAPLFESAVAGLRGYIRGSVPFRIPERLGEIDKIEEQLRTGVITHPRALVRLWSLVEDEIRMTRESAMFQQTITLDGEEVLADVVRLGMVVLFFKTRTGDFGYASPTGSGEYEFVRVGGDQKRKQIRALFDSFKRQIRVGLFRIPNALPSESE